MDFLKGRRAYVQTLGCRVNQSESAMIADSLRMAGFEVLNQSEGADVLVLNSCALTEVAEAKTRRAVKDFKRKNPEAFVCITGCYAQTNPESLLKAGVNCLVSNVEKGGLVEILVDKYYKPDSSAFCDSFEGEISKGKKNISADSGFSQSGSLSDRMNLKIQDGCDNACAYCIIPRARGLPRSRALPDIVEDARRLVSRGVCEIILTGINMSKFDASISDLCDELNAVNGLKRIAIGSLEPPVPELEQLALRMADNSHKLAKHFHISLQSASNNVLGAMRRKYSVEEFLTAVARIKEIDSSIAVGTDVICGFPGESEEDFEETIRNIKKSGLSFLHVFTYSPRPKTLAAAMSALPLAERKSRADKLRLIGEELRSAFLGEQRGKTAEILLENQLRSGEYLGYTENYIQCSVKIPQNGLKNQIAKVRITGADAAGRASCDFIGLA